MKGVGKRKGLDDGKSSSIRKRVDENDTGDGGSGSKEKLDNDNNDNVIDGLVFEDPFEDEFEEEDAEEYDEEDDDDEDGDDEDEYEDMDDDDEEDNNVLAEGEAMKLDSNVTTTANNSSTDSASKTTKDTKSKSKTTKNKTKTQKSSEKQLTSPPAATKSVWRPGVDKLEEDEELEYDPSAYVMYHSIQTEWPCLSFDFIRDDFGNHRQRFPLTMLLVTGSQADRRDRNKITMLKLSDVHKTKGNHEDDSDSDEDDDNSDDDDDDDLDEDPTIEDVSISHVGGINRIRSMPQTPGIIATMSDTASTHIYDMSATAKSLMNNNAPRIANNPNQKPLFTFKGHKEEGYALDWSSVTLGRLATGDNSGNIYLWNAANATGSSWVVDATPYTGHTNSVEDIQWSPSEGTVFISASSDRTVKVWDVRGKTGPQISFNAHESDVNVVSWNKSVNYLLASGSDDGSFKVWDLRAIRDKKEPLAHFTYHKHPITSIEWAPHDESVLCCACEDNQITIWDLSVEADDNETIFKNTSSGTNGSSTSNSNNNGALLNEDFPPQLLFIHQGQKEVKEVHYHPQIPGVIMSSAEDSMDVFKPAINVVS